MFNPILQVGGQLYATALEPGLQSNTAIITWSNGSKAVVSTKVDKGYFSQNADGNLQCNFLLQTPNGYILKEEQYEIAPDKAGFNWIRDKSKLNQKPLY